MGDTWQAAQDIEEVIVDPPLIRSLICSDHCCCGLTEQCISTLAGSLKRCEGCRHGEPLSSWQLHVYH